MPQRIEDLDRGGYQDVILLNPAHDKSKYVPFYKQDDCEVITHRACFSHKKVEALHAKALLSLSRIRDNPVRVKLLDFNKPNPFDEHVYDMWDTKSVIINTN